MGATSVAPFLFPEVTRVRPYDPPRRSRRPLRVGDVPRRVHGPCRQRTENGRRAHPPRGARALPVGAGADVRRTVRAGDRGIHQGDQPRSAALARPLPARAGLHEPAALRERDQGVQGLHRVRAAALRVEADEPVRSREAARRRNPRAEESPRDRKGTCADHDGAGTTSARPRESAPPDRRHVPAASAGARSRSAAPTSATATATRPKRNGGPLSTPTPSWERRTTTSPSSTCRPAASSRRSRS